MPLPALKNFLKLESLGGLLLISAAILALIVSNSGLAPVYVDLLATRVAVIFGGLSIDKPLLLWVNDGLMAIFFLLIGLELKREILEGQLSSRDQLILPAVGAIGGFGVPVAIYALINWGDPAALNGWAVPAATDIAFALGILMLFGDRVPLSLKMFLTSLAIIDDLAAISVIALFYTADLSLLSLGGAAAGALALLFMNRLRITQLAPYVLVGIVIWVFVLKSGVHATLAGILVALFVPMRAGGDAPSPLRRMEHAIHPWVAFLILPLFAFANAGVRLFGDTDVSLLNPVTIGIVAGLFLGKQLGVFALVWLAIRLRLAKMPEGANWASLYGVSVLSGIGFTMSLFIGTLAFEHGNFDYLNATRLGVLVGSAASVVLGCAVLYFGLARNSISKMSDLRPSALVKES